MDVDDPDADDEFFDPEPLPILGRCKAMYPFEGETDLSLDFQLLCFHNNCLKDNLPAPAEELGAAGKQGIGSKTQGLF